MRAPLLLLLILSACQSSSPVQSGPGVPAPGSGEGSAADGDEQSAPTELAVDRSVEVAAINGVMEDWHDAAAKADQARYLGHFSADAVFMGTDASERWSLEQFTKYVELHFPRGGWTYLAHDRVVALSADSSLAWFDEQLKNDNYGDLRGTGVLRMEEGSWRIVHYSMTFIVPNEVSRKVRALIHSWREANPAAGSGG